MKNTFIILSLLALSSCGRTDVADRERDSGDNRRDHSDDDQDRRDREDRRDHWWSS